MGECGSSMCRVLKSTKGDGRKMRISLIKCIYGGIRKEI